MEEERVSVVLGTAGTRSQALIEPNLSLWAERHLLPAGELGFIITSLDPPMFSWRDYLKRYIRLPVNSSCQHHPCFAREKWAAPCGAADGGNGSSVWDERHLMDGFSRVSGFKLRATPRDLLTNDHCCVDIMNSKASPVFVLVMHRHDA